MAEQRILIVGGVAGGASCAARARRLSEEAQIIIFERGPYVSFANCGLPYFVGDVIKAEADLLVASEDLFRDRFNIEVRTESEVIDIDATARQVQVRDLRNGTTYRETYDALVLAPGATPIRPPLPGIDLPGIFALRTIPDSRRIRAWLDEHHARRAVIVGAGFIGLEMAENLQERGLSVQVIEVAEQVMPPLDAEMAHIVEAHLSSHEIGLHLGDGVASFATEGDQLVVGTAGGNRFEADIVILGIGVRPESSLAERAAVQIDPRGGIVVDDHMRTTDPHIWAVGDAVGVPDYIRGENIHIPLAGPANRQGRIAADNIVGRRTEFRGVQATSVCSILGLVVATTGLSERVLLRDKMAYRKVYLHPGHHVGYFPGARPISMKLLFDADSGRVLGAQAVGEAGVERRIDVIAMAIQMRATVYDLEEAELCYAPQFGAAKDPVNMAGMIAANVLRGDATVAVWEDYQASQVYLVDVRSAEEYAAGHVPGAVNIDVNALRSRLDDIPRDKPIWVYCEVGQRGYYAQRLLVQRGVTAANVLGGMKTYRSMHGADP
jgi:NADPH-dependent 2,4-dienoyl-CoA reductase/sulfur reductase-like enzyme/rhodanese-related sulfurtransferase